MAQASQQFSPSQILDAGRRAETEGQIEYAVQFYRHLTDHLPRTPEAAKARENLLRLGALPAAAAPSSTPARSSNGSAVNGAYINGANLTPVAMTGPVAAVTPGIQAAGASAVSPSPMMAGAAPQPVRSPQAGTVSASPARGAPPTDVTPRRKFVLPKSRRRYRTGRFVARALTFVGFVDLVLGVGLLIFGALARTGIGASLLPEFLVAQQQLIGTTAGVIAILSGMLLVLGGQLARAIFDTASANRDLAAFARARAAYDAGVNEPPASDV